ncbi:MAG: replicative DNA helicase [Bdellovibrionota bacterium]
MAATGRVIPHSIEAEEAVIGGILLDNDAINVVQERLRSEDFYRAANVEIFSAMEALSDRREPIDVLTLGQELRMRGSLEESGGMDNIARLAAAVPNAANVGYYAKMVRDMSLRRRVIHESTEIINKAFEVDEGIDDFLDHAEQKILGVSDDRIHASFHRVGDIVQDSIKVVEKMYDKKEPITGVPTGFHELDKMLAGLQPSDLIILAARPAMGKTSLALSIAQWIGIYERAPVALFSLEMSKEQLVLRMLCSEARVDNSKVRTGNLGERDFPRLVDAASKIAEAPIFIDDTPAITVTELRAKARRLHKDTKLSVIVVDYLQLMRSPTYKQNREQEIADISRSLKALAKELNIPILALAQLNRSVESRTDKRPMMSELRESGAIEQDADIIMFIYRDEVYNKETSEDKGVAEIIIAKHRNGPIGTARLAFSPEITRFDNLEEQRADPDLIAEGVSIARIEDEFF